MIATILAVIHIVGLSSPTDVLRVVDVLATLAISGAALYATWSIRSINVQTNEREKRERVRSLRAERVSQLVELTNVIMRHRELFENTEYPLQYGNLGVVIGFDIGDPNDNRTKKKSDINFVIVKDHKHAGTQMSFMYRGEYEVEPSSILFEKSPGLDSDSSKWDTLIFALAEVVNRSIGGEGAYMMTQKYHELSPLEISEVTGLRGTVRGQYSMNQKVDQRFKNAIVGVNLDEVDGTKNKITHIDARDNMGRTFLHYAVYDAYRWLWHTSEYGGDGETKDSRDDDYANRMQADLDKIVDLLIEKGADVNSLDNQGMPVIYMAASVGNSSAIAKLAEKRSLINAVSEYNGMNAIQIAAYSGYPEAVEALISCGADINFQDRKGKTPLHFAIENIREDGDLKIVEMLIKRGASINTADENGKSPADLMTMEREDGIDFSGILKDIQS